MLPVLLLALGATLATARTTRAWDAEGHRIISKAASRVVAAAAPDIPEFFLLGGEQIAAASLEPDLRRARALDRLRSAERPEHFIDLELLELEDSAEDGLPDNRFEYLAVLEDNEVPPASVGFVPYAIIESMQNLTLAFAEYRRHPGDDFIRAKALYLAGVLSHYAADMSQPLHTTIHYNGRALPDKSSPHTGIHDLVDSLIGRVGPGFTPSSDQLWPRPFADPWEAVLAHLDRSHALVDRVYELEDDLDWDQKSPPRQVVPGGVADFARDREAAAIGFTARLFATAWVSSAGLELPSWRFESAQPSVE